MFGARIITEYQSVPFHMSDDKQLYEFLKNRTDVHVIEERFSKKRNKPYWVYEANDALGKALKEYYTKDIP